LAHGSGWRSLEEEVLMKKATAAGAILATAVAAMFTANPSFAQMGGSSSSNQAATVRCLGANDCKGQSACKILSGEVANSPANSGPKENSCKGQGMIYTATTEACTAKGGKVGKPLSM
jgi:hypothetical protein